MNLLNFEKNLLDSGVTRIAGLDEAGRGPLAGPIVIAAVILNPDHLHTLSHITNIESVDRNNDVPRGAGGLETETIEKYSLINDSKKVTAKRRELLFDFIQGNAIKYSIVEITHTEIDKHGIGEANKQGFIRAIMELGNSVQHVLTDHYKIENYPEHKQTNIIRGDSASISIAAASIMAKVYRDRIMLELHEKYPEYGFDKHKGYGTKFHRDQIMKIGPCEIHRKSFEPTKSLAKKPNSG